MMNKKILITGGAGYIGSHIAWDFLDAGFRVLVVDNLCTGIREMSPNAAEFVDGDIGDAGLLDSVFRGGDIGAVVHVAGSAIVPESVADPGKYYRNNTAASLVLMESCARHKVRDIIFSSSSAVQHGTPGEFLDETMPNITVSPYGTSKLMTEQMLADIGAAHGIRWCALRYFNVCGADPLMRTGDCKRNATTLVKVAMECAAGLRPQVQIFGDDYDTEDGTAVRDYIHVSDIASAHRLALSHLESGGAGGAFNIGIGRGFSVREVLAATKRVSGADFDTPTMPRRAGDPPRVVANPSKARRELHFCAKHPQLDDMLKTAWQWQTRQNTNNK
ncbi:MAG: UDP-glucose 4-epimerase GalE [Gammaproteobacteria bacterium]